MILYFKASFSIALEVTIIASEKLMMFKYIIFNNFNLIDPLSEEINIFGCLTIVVQL